MIQLIDQLPKLLLWMPGKSSRENKQEWLPFWIHAFDTAEMMIRLGDLWLTDGLANRTFPDMDREELRKLFLFLGLTHDFGKLTPSFLSRILPALPDIESKLNALGLDSLSVRDLLNTGKSSHALAGEALALSYHCSKGISSIIGAHHGKPQSLSSSPKMQLINYDANYFGSRGRDSEQGAVWHRIQSEWFDFALQYAGYDSAEDLPPLTSPQQVFLTGLLITADWIASNTNCFPYLSVDDVFANVSQRAEQGWQKISLPEGWHPLSFCMDEYVFSERFGFYPNAIQKCMLNVIENTSEPGIVILEAPMGMGKTEAALAGAELLASNFGCSGVFFGLPTQATANGIFGRILDWAESESEWTAHAVRLAHGMAALNEDYQTLFHGTASTGDFDSENHLIVHPWFEGRKQALLADFVVGTVDQLLMMALKHKHVMLRHIGLAGKVVIIDECHAYDAYMNVYLDRALEWLAAYKVPVIILSATLPSQRRKELIEAYTGKKNKGETWENSRVYPLLTWTEDQKVFQKPVAEKLPSKNVAIYKLQDEELVDCLVKGLSLGGCAGIIVNTVRRAQQIYDIITESLPENEVILFHASFIAPDRADKEKILLSRIGKDSRACDRNHLIVIGTQVLEQSLDIDFDVLITDLCPMDLLLQRMGRLHRHERKRPELLNHAVCYVLGAEEALDQGSVAVYGEWLLYRTKMLLPAVITLPGDIPNLVQDTYADPDEALLQDVVLKKAWEDRCYLLDEKERNAKQFRIKKPNQGRSGLDDWLNVEQDVSVKEMAVRDIDVFLNVLVLRQAEEGSVAFLPGQNEGRTISLLDVPPQSDARKIAAQSLNMPRALCAKWCIGKIIYELETIKADYFRAWEQSSWLQDEYFLLLDENGETDLGDVHLKYTFEQGLTYTKREEGC